MDVVFGISHRVTVLHQGRVIADGTSGQVRANKEVTAVYLGTSQGNAA
jgi:branched-chain amino acid transport system ATP-binding protein